MKSPEFTPTHINEIRAGDTVLHEGTLKTVCKSNIRQCELMGRSLFGDSYMLGAKPVLVARNFRS